MSEQEEARRSEHERAEEALKESETNYRALIDDLPELICRSAPDLTRLYVNEGYCRYFGKSRQELLGRSFLELLPEEDHEPLKEHLTSLSREDPVGTFEHRVFRHDGEVRWQQWTNRAVYDEEDGTFLGYQAVGRDFNVRKQAEEALKESEERFRGLTDASFEGIAICDEDGKVLEANRAFVDMFGYGLSETRGKDLLEFYAPEDRDRVRQKIPSDPDESYEAVGLRKDGTTFFLEVWGREASRGGSTVRISAIRDVTDRKRAEEALKKSEARYRAVVEDQTELVCRSLPDLTLTFVNEGYCRYFGKSREELVGRSFLPLILEEDREKFVERLSRLGPENPTEEVEHRVLPPSGEPGRKVRWQQWINRAIFDEGGNHLGYQSVGRDVTERKEAEEALKESEERFRQLAENVREVFWIISAAERRLLYVSPAFEEVWGRSPQELFATPEAFLDYVHPDDRAWVGRVRARMHRGEFEDEYRIVRPGGEVRWIRDRGFPIRGAGGEADRMVGVAEDVTERKVVEAALRESEERFRALAQNASDIITVLEADGTVRYESQAVERVLGYEPGERIGQDSFEQVHPDDVGKVKGAFAAIVVEGEPTATAGFRFRHKDGSWRHLEAIGRNLLSDPRVGGVVVTSRDVTERERAEEALRQSERRFRQLFENSADALFVIHPETREILDCNAEACRSLGYSREELLALRLEDFALNVLSEKDKRRMGSDTPWRRALAGEPGTIIGFHENTHRRKDGSSFPVEVGVGSIDYAGRRMVFASCRDVTERKRAEEALRESEASLAEAQRIARLGSWEYAVGEDEAHWSDELYRIFGRDPRRFVPKAKTFVRSVHPEDRNPLLKQVRKAMYEGKHYGHSAEFRVVRPQGEVRAVHARYEVIWEDEGGRPVKMSGTVQDVTERKALEDRLEHKAFHDPLTDLPNRALLMDRLVHALARMERRGVKVAMLFVDLDNFKYVNDSLGHDAGDRLLVAAAGRLKESVRPGDTTARLGGDEFAVLLEDVEDVGDATRVAERIVEALRKPFDLAGREVFCGASIGIKLGAATTGEWPEDLLRKADLALYEAKRRGKARYALFDPESERRSIRRLGLENDLRRAVERDELAVLYQPVVSLKTGRVVGAEALVRWEHPERGLVLPDEFVPLAEENGLIVPIGRRVLREACRQAKAWQGLRPAAPPPTVGVNLSARQLSHPDLVADVEAALEEAGLDPEQLTLEVTEGVLVEDAGRHVAALRELRKLGVSFAIDDFGTGYSSLSYLKRLPAGLLKLDGSFVGGIGKGAGEDEVLLEGVVGIAQGLGLSVCAEGVETAEQAAQLRELGCDLAQGFHFSEPLPGKEASEFLAGGSRK